MTTVAHARFERGTAIPPRVLNGRVGCCRRTFGSRLSRGPKLCGKFVVRPEFLMSEKQMDCAGSDDMKGLSS